MSMGKAVGRYFEGMFVADSAPQSAAESSAKINTDTREKDEDTLVIGVEEDDLFASDKEDNSVVQVQRKGRKYQDRTKERNLLRKRIKKYLSKNAVCILIGVGGTKIKKFAKNT